VIDIHSHILPCLDDGPQRVDDALEMCSIAARDGTTIIVATPHMLCDIGDPDVHRIRDAHEYLKGVLRSRGVEIDVRRAAEVHVIDDLPLRVRAGEIPLLDPSGRYLLLEPPLTGGAPAHLCEVIFRLRLDGVVPIIAHPERCEMFVREPSLAELVTDRGALIQVNADGIVEDLMHEAAAPVAAWLREGLVHVVASDAHDAVHRPPVLSVAAELCSRFLGAGETELLFHLNPASILAGEEVRSAARGG